MKIIGAALLGSALLLGGATGAEATIVYETYTGTIAVGADTAGRFGAPNNDLSGKTLKIQYRFDLNAGGIVYDNGSTTYQYYGGPAYGTPVISTVKVSVDGVSRNFGSSYYSVSDNRKYLPAGTYDQVYAYSNDYPQSGEYTQSYVYSYTDDFLSSYGPDAHANYTATSSKSFGYSQAYDSAGFQANTNGNPVHVTVGSSATGVPEPAALALFGLGAAVLAATRRR